MCVCNSRNPYLLSLLFITCRQSRLIGGCGSCLLTKSVIVVVVFAVTDFIIAVNYCFCFLYYKYERGFFTDLRKC